METIFNFSKFHSPAPKKEKKANDNRKQIPPTLKPPILFEKKLISNVKKWKIKYTWKKQFRKNLQ